MTRQSFSCLFLISLCLAQQGWCFVPKAAVSLETKNRFQPSALEMTPSNSNNNEKNSITGKGRTAAVSLVAAAFLLSSTVGLEPAAAFSAHDNDLFGSSEIIAGRSGGRMGGRSSMGSRSAPRSAPRSVAPSRSYNSQTTIVRPGPVIVAPTPIYSPFGFNPFGGFGTCFNNYSSE